MPGVFFCAMRFVRWWRRAFAYTEEVVRHRLFQA